jgi:hypothetical protein
MAVLLPNATVQKIKLILRILGVSDPNLGQASCYPEVSYHFSQFFWVAQDYCLQKQVATTSFHIFFLFSILNISRSLLIQTVVENNIHFRY